MSMSNENAMDVCLQTEDGRRLWLRQVVGVWMISEPPFREWRKVEDGDMPMLRVAIEFTLASITRDKAAR